MPDAILEKAKAKRDASLREAERWSDFIRQCEELRADADATPQQAPRSVARPRRDAQRSLPEDSELAKTIAMVDAVLDAFGRPVPLSELYNAVTKSGLIIHGKRPRDVLGARLYNSNRYRSQGKQTGWWFKDRPIPIRETAPALKQATIAPSDSSDGGLFGPPHPNERLPVAA
ncbi:MAG: hypothetical protein JO305_00450 [Alphaproteobacteria bacterium]|nr:hypothetical protein [Alphaproteobacteria bacterium]